MSLPEASRMTCPRCAVSALSPDTGTCEVCGYRLDASVAVERQDALADLVARQLAHEFDIVEVVGRREGTVVLRAIEKNGGRKVMLKARQRRADDPDSEARFRDTMESHAQLDHPNLIPVLRFGVTDSLLWFAMPDVGGHSLRATRQEKKRLDPRDTRRMATQLVSALEYLHRRGIAHGAVKPENVIIDAAGWARLVDPAFGRRDPMRRRTSGSQPVIAENAPREAWVAPEEYTGGERTPATDQFALASLVFECVAGEAPLEPGEQVSRFRPEVPVAMSQAIARGLQALPARRFATCTDFLFALEQDAPVAVAESRPSGRMSTDALLIHDWEPPEAAPKPRKNPVAIAAIALLVVATAVAAPSLITKFQAMRAPQAIVAPLPVILPSTPVQTPPPSAQRVAGEIANTTPAPAAVRPQPTSGPQSSTASTPSAAARTAPADRAPVAPVAPSTPSSIPSTPVAAPVINTTGGGGKLTVNASPWGQVFVDDRFIGNTPRANIELPAGTHTLRVSRQGFESVTRSVTIKAGETVRITNIVLTPIAP
jgi:serine/threonine-protein kinase